VKVGDLVKLSYVSWARSYVGLVGLILAVHGRNHYEVLWNDGTRWEDCLFDSLELISESR
jgi:hypothetical protein